MKKTTLEAKVQETINDTRAALQTVYAALNNGQQKQIVKVKEVKAIFDRYGVAANE